MTYTGADNTLSLPDHADHIHVGFRPLYGSDSKLGRQLNSALKPGQWIKLIDRLGADRQPDGPDVAVEVRDRRPQDVDDSKSARASDAHVGE